MKQKEEYACIVYKAKKTKKFNDALRDLHLTDEQIKYSKQIRFSNRAYEIEAIKKMIANHDYTELFSEKGISKNSFHCILPYTFKLGADNKIDAYLKRDRALRKFLGKKSSYISIQDIKRDHRVYALRLNPTILENKKFLEANPGLDLRGNPGLFYIGSTGKSIAARYNEHRVKPDDGSNDKGSKFIRPHLKGDFIQANATLELLTDPKWKIDNLSYSKALETERFYGESLKSSDIGIWWN